MNRFVFKRPDRIYKEFFKIERKMLQSKLSRIAKIEHVGSTAVPGLGGKNSLDIAVGSKTGLRVPKAPLMQLGYEFKKDSGSATRLFFLKQATYRGKRIRIHLHLMKLNGKDWNEMVLFRDYLIRNKGLLLEYIEVKKKAAKLAAGDKEIYKKAKNDFIKSVMKMAQQDIKA